MNCRNSDLPDTAMAPSCGCGRSLSDISGPGPVVRPVTNFCFDDNDPRFPIGTLKIIEKGKVYTIEELSDYDLFTCGTGILQEWYRTKDAILRYYVGDNYAELAANWKRKERTGNE